MLLNILWIVFKDEQFKLMKQKGVYPYDYMSCVDKLNDTKLSSKMIFTAS